VAINRRPFAVVIGSALAFAAGCYFLAFGSAILCCVSGHRGENFWQTEKFFYGLMPMAVSAVVLAVAARRWAHSFSSRRNAWLLGSVVALFVVLGEISLSDGYASNPKSSLRLGNNNRVPSTSAQREIRPR